MLHQHQNCLSPHLIVPLLSVILFPTPECHHTHVARLRKSCPLIPLPILLKINDYLFQIVGFLGQENSLTKLVVDLNSTHPDDAFSRVPYEKGSLFLRYLEDLVGGPGKGITPLCILGEGPRGAESADEVGG